MGSIYDIMDAFRTVRPLIDIPDAWRMCFEETPEASCWYPAHIGCQVRFLRNCLSQLDFDPSIHRLCILEDDCGAS